MIPVFPINQRNQEWATVKFFVSLSQYLSNRPSRQISQTLSSPNNVSLRKSNKTINSFSGWKFLCRKIRTKKCPTLANTIQVMTRKKLVQI